MICRKCGKDKAHRAERKNPVDHVLNWIFLKPYACRECSYRFHAFPSGVNGPTLRMEVERRFQFLTRRSGRRGSKADLMFYLLAAMMLGGLIYLVVRQIS